MQEFYWKGNVGPIIKLTEGVYLKNKNYEIKEKISSLNTFGHRCFIPRSVGPQQLALKHPKRV